MIHGNDRERLAELGERIREAFADNVAQNAAVTASETADGAYSPDNILDDDSDSFWMPKAGSERAELVVAFTRAESIEKVVLMENIRIGQRIEAFTLEYRKDGQWQEFFHGTVVGYKRICSFECLNTDAIRIRILQSRLCPTFFLGRIVDFPTQPGPWHHGQGSITTVEW